MTRRTSDPLVAHLARARVQARLTQEQVAHRIGIASRAVVCDWEAGRRSPSLANLRRWSTALGFELSLAGSRDVPD